MLDPVSHRCLLARARCWVACVPARPRSRDSDRQSPLPPRQVLRRGAGLLTRCRLLDVPALPMSLRLGVRHASRDGAGLLAPVRS